MNEWRLKFDKNVGFDLDGASIMIGKQNEVAMDLKDNVNDFFNLHSLCGT